MTVYYIDLDYGCSLVSARTKQSAERRARETHGSYHFRFVRPATREDVSWIRAMGGYVPDGKVAK